MIFSIGLSYELQPLVWQLVHLLKRRVESTWYRIDALYLIFIDIHLLWFSNHLLAYFFGQLIQDWACTRMDRTKRSSGQSRQGLAGFVQKLHLVITCAIFPPFSVVTTDSSISTLYFTILKRCHLEIFANGTLRHLSLLCSKDETRKLLGWSPQETQSMIPAPVWGSVRICLFSNNAEVATWGSSAKS